MVLALGAAALGPTAGCASPSSMLWEHACDLDHPWHAAPFFAGMIVSGMVVSVVCVLPFVVVVSVYPDAVDPGMNEYMNVSFLGGDLLAAPFFVVGLPLELIPSGENAEPPVPPKSEGVLEVPPLMENSSAGDVADPAPRR